ncbi:MAG: lysophospholipid acyltransferase family protein [Gemmatimonadaceae bacterium]
MKSESARTDRAPSAGPHVRLAVRMGVVVVRLLAVTWRMRTVGVEIVAALRAARQPIVFTLWHGQMLPLLWHHRGQGIAVLISEHRDGEIIARVASTLGFRTIRGSTYRGANRALVGLMRELRAGHDVAVTPDGPRGPAGHFAPGALVAAQRAGAPIVAVGVAATRAWRLRSWDGFMIPKPFARVTVAYGQDAVQSATARDAAAEAPRFQRLMEATISRAMRL